MYVCGTCSEHFTRKYSGDRHNSTLHESKAEILPILEYIVGRASGLYMPDNPLRYRRYQGHSPFTPADQNSKFDYSPQSNIGETPTTFNQYYPSRTSRTTLSTPNPSTLGRVSKLTELQTLAHRYLSPSEAKLLLKWASMQGNDWFLDLHLEQFRSRDKYRI